MGKKEVSFKEKVEVAGEELEKSIKDGGTVILIASEVQDVESSLVYFAGNKTTALVLLASLAHTDEQFRKLLEDALLAAALKKQIEK